MMRSFLIAAAAALTMLMSNGGAHAQAAPDFTLINSTGYTISEVYVSRPKADSWGDDIMGKENLEDGNHVKISFNTDACTWDIKVVYDDDSKAVWSSVNLCKIEKVTLFWDSANEKTRAVSE